MPPPWRRPDTDKPYPDDGPSPPFRGCFWQFNNPDGAIRRRHPGLQVLISLGGWTLSRGFSDAACTEQGRRKLVDSIIRFVEKYRFDGIGGLEQHCLHKGQWHGGSVHDAVVLVWP